MAKRYILTFPTKSVVGVRFYSARLEDDNGVVTHSTWIPSKEAMLAQCVRLFKDALADLDAVTIDTDPETKRELSHILIRSSPGQVLDGL